MDSVDTRSGFVHLLRLSPKFACKIHKIEAIFPLQPCRSHRKTSLCVDYSMWASWSQYLRLSRHFSWLYFASHATRFTFCLHSFKTVRLAFALNSDQTWQLRLVKVQSWARPHLEESGRREVKRLDDNFFHRNRAELRKLEKSDDEPEDFFLNRGFQRKQEAIHHPESLGNIFIIAVNDDSWPLSPLD